LRFEKYHPIEEEKREHRGIIEKNELYAIPDHLRYPTTYVINENLEPEIKIELEKKIEKIKSKTTKRSTSKVHSKS